MSKTRFHFLLADRILRDKGNRFSRPIVTLSVCGVSLGLVIMMIAIGITSGYKQEIRDKVIAMGSHIRITHYDENRATKVGIVTTTDQVEGIVLKGMDATFNQALFRSNILEGDTLQLGDTVADNHIIISKHLSDKLMLKVGDKIQTYFVQDPPRARSFVIAAIYQTGLPEYDNLFAIVDLRHIQKLNDWSDNQVSGMEVLIRDYDKIAEMGDFVHHHVPYELKAETIHQIYPEIFEWIALFDTNVAVLLIITTCEHLYDCGGAHPVARDADWRRHRAVVRFPAAASPLYQAQSGYLLCGFCAHSFQYLGRGGLERCRFPYLYARAGAARLGGRAQNHASQRGAVRIIPVTILFL